MSGIAEILVRMGFPVSGSDLSDSDTVRRLRDLGVRVEIGHRAENIEGAKAIVTSSAVTKTNPEVLEAHRRHLPIVARAEMLAELMRLKYGLAVAGTHGKTTTTSLLGSILTYAELDPTIIVGGKVDALGGNAKFGQGQFLVAEADESDGSFLKLSPVVTIITNIDNDHLDHHGSMQLLRTAFAEFANGVPYYGRNIVCIDDAEVQDLIKSIEKPVWTYGFSKAADFQIRDFEHAGINGSRFSVWRSGQFLTKVTLNIPGEHNARNAVGALAAAIEVDVSVEIAVRALASFTGVRRRFETKARFEKQNITIVDDYGHHPTEIDATLAAAYLSQKANGHQRVVVIFQPHRYSRTASCWNQFAASLSKAAQVFLLDVYAAGEAPITGVNSATLTEALKTSGVPVEYLPVPEQTSAAEGLAVVAKTIKSRIKNGDLIITLGAGNITTLGPLLASELSK